MAVATSRRHRSARRPANRMDQEYHCKALVGRAEATVKGGAVSVGGRGGIGEVMTPPTRAQPAPPRGKMPEHTCSPFAHQPCRPQRQQAPRAGSRQRRALQRHTHRRRDPRRRARTAHPLPQRSRAQPARVEPRPSSSPMPGALSPGGRGPPARLPPRPGPRERLRLASRVDGRARTAAGRAGSVGVSMLDEGGGNRSRGEARRVLSSRDH